MKQQSMCLQDFLGASVSVKGTSDLTLGDLKISGNAQRRGRRSVLFHGTILCQVDISAISRYLKVPSYQPDYRANRGHADFVRSLGVDPLGLRQHMSQWWQPDSASTEIPYEQLKTDLTLLKETYLNPTFIYQR
jgi:lipoate-protein ligase A